MSLILQKSPVQSVGGFTPSGDYTRTYSLTGVTAGSTLLFVSGSFNIKGNVRAGAGEVKSVSDSAGGSPSLLRKQHRASGDDSRNEHWYLPNAAAGTHTWTVTYDGVGDGAGNYGTQSDTGVLIEIGGTVASPVDAAGATLQGADNVVDSALGPTATLAQAHELAIASLYTGKDGIALPSGWESVALRQADSFGFSLGVAALEVTVPYPVGAQFTHAAAPYGTSGLLSLFKVADTSGGGGTGGTVAPTPVSTSGYVVIEAQPEAVGLANVEGVVWSYDGTRCGAKLFEFPHSEAAAIAFDATLNANGRAQLRVPIPSALVSSLTDGQQVQLAAHDTTDAKGMTYIRGATVRLTAPSGGGVTPAPALVPVTTAGYRSTDAAYKRLYGPGLAVVDYLYNLNAYLNAGTLVYPAMVFRAPFSGYIDRILFYLSDGGGYAGGNGGNNVLRIATVDTANKPQLYAGTTIGTSRLQPGSKMSGGVYVNPDDRFVPLVFSRDAQVEAGQLYCVTMRNTDGSPGTNYSSLDFLATVLANPQPNLFLEGVGWRGWFGSEASPASGGEPSWTDVGSSYGGSQMAPIAQIFMADGRSFGYCPMESSNQEVDGSVPGTKKRWANGNTKPFRERFQPINAKSATGVSVLTSKVSGSGGLLCELKNGSTVLASATIPDTGNDYGLDSTVGTNVVQRAWRHAALSATATLPAGSTIDLVMTPQGTSVWAMASQRKGIDLGSRNFSADAVFAESFGQHYDGSNWLGANGWNHTVDGGAAWSWPVLLHLAG